MENTEVLGVELDWDAPIEKESEFILLPDGDYDFTVESFEKKRFDGSKKMAACNMAVLNIRIDTDQGSAHIFHNLYLNSKTEWVLSAFFASIGQKKRGEVLNMKWQLVPGSKGKCKVGHEDYNGNTYNRINKFYPAYDQEVSFTPGEF